MDGPGDLKGEGCSGGKGVVRLFGLGRVGLCCRFHSQALQALIGPKRCQVETKTRPILEDREDQTSRPLNGLLVFRRGASSLVVGYGELPSRTIQGCTSLLSPYSAFHDLNPA